MCSTFNIKRVGFGMTASCGIIGFSHLSIEGCISVSSSETRCLTMSATSPCSVAFIDPCKSSCHEWCVSVRPVSVACDVSAQSPKHELLMSSVEWLISPISSSLSF